MMSKQAAMRDAYGEALLELGATNPDVVVVGADTTGSLKSVLIVSTFEKNTRIPIGIANDTTRLSPRRSVSISSARVCAATA